MFLLRMNYLTIIVLDSAKLENFVKVEKTLFKKVCVIHEEIYVF